MSGLQQDSPRKAIRRLRRGAAAASVLMIELCLVSCGPPFTNNLSPVDFGLVGSYVALAFCSPETVLSLRVEQRPVGSTSIDDWEDVWRGEGSLRVPAGEVLVLDDRSDLPGEPLETLDTQAGTKFTTYIKLVSNYGGSAEVAYQPNFTAPPGGLKEGQWIDSYGRISDVPCEGQ